MFTLWSRPSPDGRWPIFRSYSPSISHPGPTRSVPIAGSGSQTSTAETPSLSVTECIRAFYSHLPTPPTLVSVFKFAQTISKHVPFSSSSFARTLIQNFVELYESKAILSFQGERTHFCRGTVGSMGSLGQHGVRLFRISRRCPCFTCTKDSVKNEFGYIGLVGIIAATCY